MNGDHCLPLEVDVDKLHQDGSRRQLRRRGQRRASSGAALSIVWGLLFGLACCCWWGAALARSSGGGGESGSGSPDQSPTLASLLQFQSEDNTEAVDSLKTLCHRKQPITSLSEMRKLVAALRALRGQHGAQFSPSRFSWSARVATSGRSSLEQCLRHMHNLLDLEELLDESETADVCSARHVDKIERYLAAHRQPAGFWLLDEFVKLYAEQVAFRCKSSLLHSLGVAAKLGLADEQDLVRAVPWLARQDGQCQLGASGQLDELLEREARAARLATNGLASQQQSSASHQQQRSAARLDLCLARSLLTLTSVQELAELTSQDRSSKHSLMERVTGVGGPPTGAGQPRAEGGQAAELPAAAAEQEQQLYLLVVPEGQTPVIEGMLAACRRLRPVYENTIMPIVRLIRLGFDPPFATFDRVCQTNQMVQNWLAAVALCDALLGSRLELAKRDSLGQLFHEEAQGLLLVDELDGSKEEQQQPETVDGEGQSLQGSSSLSYAQIVAALPKIGLDDELWLHKYRKTKFGAFRDTVRQRFMKAFNVISISDHVIFRRRVKDLANFSFRLLLVALAVVLVSSTLVTGLGG